MMNNNFIIKQKNGFFYKFFIEIRQFFKRNKYVIENEIENGINAPSNQFKNNIKSDSFEIDNEYKKKRFMENLKNNQEVLENFSNERLKSILKYYLDENEKKREILRKKNN